MPIDEDSAAHSADVGSNPPRNAKEDSGALGEPRKAGRVDDTSVGAQINLGIMYCRRGDIENGIQCFDTAISCAPDYADAYFNRACAREMAGKTREAIADYTQAIRLEPAHLDAFYNRGMEYLEMREFEKAIADFTRVLQLNPQEGRAYGARATVWMHFGRETKNNDYLREAIDDYRKALVHSPTSRHAGIHEDIALAFDLLGLRQEAIASLTDAIDADPDAAELYYLRGSHYRRLGDHETAIEDLSRAVSLNGQLWRAYQRRALACLDLGRHRQATSDFEKAAELSLQHVPRGSLREIAGTFDGEPVTHYLDETTRVDVIRDSAGNILDVLELNEAYLNDVLTHGAL